MEEKLAESPAKTVGKPKKKKRGKEFQKKLILTLVPPLAHRWMAWFDKTARANNHRLLTLINADKLVERVGGHQSPSILAIWHNRLMFGPTAYQYCKGRGAVVMISRSFDGDVIEAVLGRFKNIEAARGSSSKKGRDKGGHEALEQMVEYGRQGLDLVITPDGPLGPVYKVKKGVIELARTTGLPIFAIGPNAEPHFEAKSWDKTRVPFPYARFVYKVADPMYVPADADDELIEQKRRELENTLIELTEFADHFFDKE